MGPAPSVATLRLESLEVARGHDGFLRGRPEPALLLAIFGCRVGRATLLGRRAVRFRSVRAIPCALAPTEDVVMTPILADGDTHALVLAIGVEVDGGRDLARLFGALEHVDRWSAWEAEGAIAAPRHLEELATTCVDGSRRVHLLLDGTPIEDGPSDDVVGASATALAAGVRARRDARLALLSPDRRNDWTTLARVAMRAPAR